MNKQEKYTEKPKQSEETLHDERLAMDQHANISVVDADGKIISVNNRFCESTGYSREELIGRDYHFRKSNCHPNTFYKAMWDTVTSGEVWHGETCECSKDGVLIWSDATVVPFMNAAGTPYKHIIIRSDITARKLMEEAVAEKRIYLQNITNSMGDGVIAGDSTGKITFVNVEACSLLNCQEEELIGGDINDFIFGRIVDSELSFREENPLLRALHRFQTYREENGTLHRQDETSLPIAYTVAPLIDDNGYAGSITVFRDITNRKRAEQKQQALIKKLQEAHTQLLQSEKMASIGQLAAGVAHEINNPVGYINSNLGSMRQYVADFFKLLEAYNKLQQLVPEDNPVLQELQKLEQKLDLAFLKEDIKSLLEETNEGIHRVKQIVNDLKDFSRLDSTEWHWADLEVGLNSTLNIVQNEIKYKADVIKEYAGIPQIECIGSQLNQVFMNLLVNGAHAIEERGTITIRTGMDGGDWIWVEIADTGKGIKPEALSRIFDPFYTTKPVGKGTGLGLSLSYSIVERHGGKIEVESTVGEGTCFRVRLPASQTEKKETSSEGNALAE